MRKVHTSEKIVVILAVCAEREIDEGRMAWLGCIRAFHTVLGCRASSPNWNGTWALNPSIGTFRGPVITISISANGEYRYDDGMVSTTFRCDGKYQPIGKGRSQNCVKSSATTLDKTRLENGEKTITSHWGLSDGGKVLTETAKALRPSSPAVTSQFLALRISGSNGFAGQWRDTTPLQQRADMTLRVDGRYLQVVYPST